MDVTTKSLAWSITKIDLEKWLKNTILFFVPVLVLFYLPFLRVSIETDGFSFNDFIPNKPVITAIMLFLVNVMYDFLLKFVPERKI